VSLIYNNLALGFNQENIFDYSGVLLNAIDCDYESGSERAFYE